MMRDRMIEKLESVFIFINHIKPMSHLKPVLTTPMKEREFPGYIVNGK